MPKLEWLESFELGVPEIDGDHRTMFRLIKAVQSTALRDRNRARKYLDRFLDFTRSLFAREETLLRDRGYPGTATHAHYHAEIPKQAEAARRLCDHIEEPEALEKCCNELISFLVDDVVRGDLKLKSFLEEAGLALAVR